uniref:Uncharacterized protein n=1 Tax=Anopheles atroparvus TaxID=41427 RepID=A0A182INE0_ANOAO
MVVPTMDSLPRVPDTHGDTVDEKVFSDLYIRTSWFDASIALDQIEKFLGSSERFTTYSFWVAGGLIVKQSHPKTFGRHRRSHHRYETITLRLMLMKLSGAETETNRGPHDRAGKAA